MSSFTTDPRGRPADEVEWLGHPVTVETPPAPNELPRDPQPEQRRKRMYRYPDWRRRKNGRK